MSLSRQRQSELDELKRTAEDLWEQQQAVVDRASAIAREAGRQVGAVAREEVAPRVRSVVETGGSAVRGVADGARHRLTHDVVPAVTGAAATALAAIDVIRDRQLRAAISGAGRFGTDLGVKVGIIEPPKKSSPLPWILIGVGVVAVAAVGYAVWQTLRADDDLRVEDAALEAGADDLIE